jgi:hypothetical protein
MCVKAKQVDVRRIQTHLDSPFQIIALQCEACSACAPVELDHDGPNECALFGKLSLRGSIFVQGLELGERVDEYSEMGTVGFQERC